ncbi:MAG: hydantoinase B/oxoprolinase family protein [Acidimicrobiales bacterium]
MDAWKFWIDRGGTFTDVVARSSDGRIVTHKLLSQNPQLYSDAATEGIRRLLGVPAGLPLPSESIQEVKMGTTVATNALLERQGEPTVFVTTRGFGDSLRIGYQARPDIFALDIVLPEMLYGWVVEVEERVSATGEVLTPADLAAAQADLRDAYRSGARSAAIVLLHGYRYPDHERQLAEVARKVGFEQVSVSSEVSALQKLVPRGDTTVVDAYLSPILGRYVSQVANELGAGPRLSFMQSNGGLTDAHRFRGKDALLSGPAGGVVGMIRTAAGAGYDRLIGFDMGGTSTDVSHFAGELERTYDAEVAGVRVRAPMMQIHTVAAGGGSILTFDGSRLRVGPESAGADPGPTCYGNGGPLAITDCNVLLGKLRPEFFPQVFGPAGDGPLDIAATRSRFAALTNQVNEASGSSRTAEELAEGFLAIAVENMANAIKKISVQRGHDVTDHTLVCFGGAGGQHACMVADRLAIERIHVHPNAGVLSALGIGLADTRHVGERAIEALLDSETLAGLEAEFAGLELEGEAALLEQGLVGETIESSRVLALRYDGSDTALFVAAADIGDVVAEFEHSHRSRFGFVADQQLVVESIHVEMLTPGDTLSTERVADGSGEPEFVGETFMAGGQRQTPFVNRSDLQLGVTLPGPAVVIESDATTVVEPGWGAELLSDGGLVLERVEPRPSSLSLGTDVDPIQLEIFNNLFMNIAEQMGLVLENTAASVNIKERLDFSCAVFDPSGDLIANAPHMPVHLGSMGDSIKAIIANNPNLARGDVYVTNAPYNGGTHLPDVTVVKPIFGATGAPIFYVAARGHHADIGGTVPGSAPADSTTVEEEGVLLDNVLLVSADEFRHDHISSLLTQATYPARNPKQNIADLQAQVAACEKGATELARVVGHYGLDVVHAYMGHVKDNAEESVRRVIDALTDSTFEAVTDDGHVVRVAITVDAEARSATIDFRGTSPQHPGNYNAPAAVCHAAVLYVFRCLVDDQIPLNSGCMVPLEVILPERSMINPEYPAAVIAGNVETSQLIVDTLFGAVEAMAASQGTMNNVIWGNDTHQYYETVCGGAGATGTADGCSAVQTHMTNSRLTDPEILEWRYPVRLESFEIRHGSGGSGRHVGGNGVVRRVSFQESMTVNILSSRREIQPFGLHGGSPGASGENFVIRSSGERQQLPGNTRVEVEPGDTIEVHTPGGGGFGPPSSGADDTQKSES